MLYIYRPTMYIGLEPRREGYLRIGSSSFMLSVTVYRSCGLHGWADLPFPGERLVGTSSCFRQYRVLDSIVGMGGTSWWTSASVTLLVGNVVIWGWHYNLPFSSY